MQNSRYWLPTRHLHLRYSCCAFGGSPTSWTAYIIHLVDIAVLTTLLFWAKDQIGAFFAVFILFLLLAASLRWAWRGAIATAIGLGAIVLLLGVISTARRLSDCSL